MLQRWRKPNRLTIRFSPIIPQPLCGFAAKNPVFPLFQRGVGPLLELLLSGREDAVLSAQTDQTLRTRIEKLASKNTEDALTPEERDEYAGYVRRRKAAKTENSGLPVARRDS